LVRSPLRVANTLRNGIAFALAFVALAAIPLGQRASGGDTSRDGIILGGFALLGLVTSAVYTRFESSSERSRRARAAAWTVIRYFLAYEFVRYGMAKVVGMQFYRRFYLLDSRVVDMKPMNLAWSFFGHSYGYQAITGAIELVGALLLCFRRTTTLGACVLFSVMSNVVLVNFYYDVSVKLFSSIFLTMIVYLLGLEAKRFWTFFVTDERPPPREYLRPPRSVRARVAHGAWVAIVLLVPTADITHDAMKHRLFTDEPLLGAWKVDKEEGLEQLVSDAPQPSTRIYFEKGDYGFIRVGSKRIPFTFQFDESAGQLRMSMDVPPKALVGRFDRHDHTARFGGTVDGRAFALELTRDFPR
jgi:uncharacterized membrane protein YphA (DoxX/SURF4 family)